MSEGRQEAINELMEPGVATSLRTLLEPSVEARGFELVLVQFRREQGHWILRLFIGSGGSPSEAVAAPADDGSAQGGVTIADCQAVSREVSAILDVEDPIPQAFRLEVSSPGLERPLVKPHDFVRFSGQVVRVRTQEAVAGRRKHRGVLDGLDGEDVVLQDAGEVVRIPYRVIQRARIEYQF